jgi:hypothetical protein
LIKDLQLCRAHSQHGIILHNNNKSEFAESGARDHLFEIIGRGKDVDMIESQMFMTKMWHSSSKSIIYYDIGDSLWHRTGAMLILKCFSTIMHIIHINHPLESLYLLKKLKKNPLGSSKDLSINRDTPGSDFVL